MHGRVVPSPGRGFYEKGRKISLKHAVPSCGSQVNFSETDLPNAKASRVLIIPADQKREWKRNAALEAMNCAEAIPMRPHLLLCADVSMAARETTL